MYFTPITCVLLSFEKWTSSNFYQKNQYSIVIFVYW
jgi:hypothetical protein